MHDPGFSFFQGLPAEELATMLDRLEHRCFPAGTRVLEEGDTPREMYVLQRGVADVFISDGQSQERRISRVGPGATLGEMALFTGHAASATVRAATDLDVLVLSEADFQHIAARFPILYRNLGIMLSDRLARTNRSALHAGLGRVSLLLDRGAPPLLGWMLACSVAWHTRRATLLLIVADREPATELAARATYAGAWVPARGAGVAGSEARAHLALTRPTGAFAPEALAATLDELRGSYDHVLLQVESEAPPALGAMRAIVLSGSPYLARTGENTPHPLIILTDARGHGSDRPDRQGILRVPSPAPADEHAIEHGLLPSTTPAGRALGWAARDLAALKVGLALGTGGTRGYAHFGVLRVLLGAGVPLDMIAGTSIGAVVAALHALGHDPDQAAKILDQVGMLAFRPTLPLTALLSSSALQAGIRRIAGSARIEDLRLPLGIVAADIITGQQVIFRRGLLWPAVMASLSIPGIFPPRRIGPYMLVDGGIVNPVPVNVVVGMGADLVIAVKLANRSIPPAIQAEARATGRGAPSMMQTIMRAIDVLQSQISMETAAAATFQIEPVLEDRHPVGLRNFNQGRRYIALGEAAASAALPRITAALPWLRG